MNTFSKMAILLATGLFTQQFGLAVGTSSITWLSSTPTKPAYKDNCKLPSGPTNFIGVLGKLEIPNVGLVEFEPKDISIHRSKDGFYVSYMKGKQTFVVNNKSQTEPLSLFGIGNNLNGDHYFAFRNPYCTGYFKLTMKDYTDKDFAASAKASMEPEPEKTMPPGEGKAKSDDATPSSDATSTPSAPPASDGLPTIRKS